MKAIGYIRVSTEDQAAHGVSLDAQRAKIEAYALTKDLTLVGVIEDAGKSAKDLRRPGVRQVLEMARKREIDAVIIVKLDRMFRNTVDALNTTQDFDKRGVALHSIHESLDTQSAMGKFFFTLTAALAEMERGVTAERVKTALARKKEKGEVYGEIPFGYQARRGKLVPNPAEQEVLQIIHRLRTEGMTYQAIADRLNQERIGTKKGRMWDRVRVFKIAKNAA